MKHTYTTPSRWRRKVLGLPVAAWLIGLAGTAVAVVGFFVTLNLTGSVSVADGIDVTYDSIAPPAGGTAGSSAGITCNYTLTGADTIDIQIGGALPGDGCSFKLFVRNDGAADAYLTGATTTDPNLIATVDHATGAAIGCNDVIAAGGSVEEVQLWVEVGMGVAPSDVLTFSVGDGLTFGIESDPSCT